MVLFPMRCLKIYNLHQKYITISLNQIAINCLIVIAGLLSKLLCAEYSCLVSILWSSLELIKARRPSTVHKTIEFQATDRRGQGFSDAFKASNSSYSVHVFLEKFSAGNRKKRTVILAQCVNS